MPQKKAAPVEDLPVKCAEMDFSLQIAGRPILHRGKRLVDAAVFEAVPFRAAIADGCTHIITLCSRPPLQCAPLAVLYASCHMPYMSFRSGKLQ